MEFFIAKDLPGYLNAKNYTFLGDLYHWWTASDGINNMLHINLVKGKQLLKLSRLARVVQWWACQTYDLVVVSLIPVEGTFLSGVFSRKVVGGFGKKSYVSSGVRKPGKTCVSYDMTLAVKVVLTLSQTSPRFYVSAVQVFWKHCGKRRNCS